MNSSYRRISVPNNVRREKLFYPRSQLRRNSNSLNRDRNANRNDPDRKCEDESTKAPEIEHHREDSNEKIIPVSNCVSRLSCRSSFYKLYDLGARIGQGNFSEVFIVQCQENETKYAVKEIDKTRIKGKVHFVENEIAILKRCRHKNICQLIEAFECTSYYFLVFEYAQKGDLFETVKRLGKLNEKTAATITQQIALAINYLHNKNIVHRDLKPENILLATDSVSAKLTDFGLACFALGPLYRVCGTPTYIAPEILYLKGYGVEVDVWSLGIILHIMLMGFAPFRCTDKVQLFNLIKKAKVPVDSPSWYRTSEGAKSLVLNLLTANREERLTALEVSNHGWIAKMLSQ